MFPMMLKDQINFQIHIQFGELNYLIYILKKTKPKFVAHVFGVIKDSGASVNSDCLGVILNDNPPYVIQRDLSKGTLAYKSFKNNPEYIRTEYHYVIFQTIKNDKIIKYRLKIQF